MAVNVENINKVIELIREERVAEFDMRYYRSSETQHPCGTAGCIAGFATIAAGHNLLHTHENSVNKIARDFLGLDYVTGTNLFNANDGYYRVPYPVFSKRDAIVLLEHLRDTGKLDISILPHAV